MMALNQGQCHHLGVSQYRYFASAPAKPKTMELTAQYRPTKQRAIDASIDTLLKA